MHLLGIIKVIIHAKDAHIRPSTAAEVRRVCSGSGTDAVASDRRVMTVDCVPSDSDAQEYFALGTSAALPAMDRARDSKVRPPSSETSSRWKPGTDAASIMEPVMGTICCWADICWE